jgi:hypothetical protein
MNIRKYLRGMIAVALFAGMVPAAQAATSGPHSFNVTVTLTSACTLPAAITPLAFGTYTAFQGAALVATPTAATFSCTRGLTGITANFDTAAPGSTAAAPAATAVGAGVIQGLQYGITATPGTVTAGTAASASSIGTADTRVFDIAGIMAANQAGDPTVNASPQARTLTLTF